jgi:ATP-dependent Clp protease, protease subunit
MNTLIHEMTEHGPASYDVFSKLIDHRVLFLYGYITDNMATDIVASILYLDQRNNDPISIYINSDGGMIRSAFMIYDAMDLSQSRIDTYCIGSAMHESLLILAGGNKRYATENSIMCLNQLDHIGLQFSDLLNAEIRFEQSQKENDKLVKALSKRIGKSYDKIMKDSEKEFFMNAQDAKKYGIIDEIINA